MLETRDLSERIQAQLEAADDKIRQMQAEAAHDFRELRERHEEFIVFAKKLIAEAGFPLKTLAGHFENAEVERSEDLRGFHAKCTFKHTPRFPASVELKFDLTHDDEVRKIIVTKNVEILPVFMEYERSDQFVLDLEGESREKALKWIQDEVVSFVETYLKIQFVDQYQSVNLVTDPVAKVRFSRSFSKGEAEFKGHKYYFISEETRREFESDPKSYISS
jgi:YHS domain-containing protein